MQLFEAIFNIATRLILSLIWGVKLKNYCLLMYNMAYTWWSDREF
jgi:hypothetical protein